MRAKELSTLSTSELKMERERCFGEMAAAQNSISMCHSFLFTQYFLSRIKKAEKKIKEINKILDYRE